MRRRLKTRSGSRRGSAAVALVTALWGTFPARGAAEAPPDPAGAHELGRYCTPLGCVSPRQSGLASAVGFGLAALAAVALSRRAR
jgi:hypothetical protein